MKRVSLFLLALSISGVSYAQSDVKLSICEDVSKTSTLIMGLRQSGTPISNMMRVTADMGVFSDLAKIIVKDAYSEPLWGTDGAKQRAITEFGNKHYLECLDRLDD